ncbi:MAG: MFS transporter [Leptospirales bacterium]|jgi:MFS family permease
MRPSGGKPPTGTVGGGSSRKLITLSFFAFAAMFPGTLSAPVLREFVQEIYTVGPDGAAWFLSVGMFGSIVAAPFVGRACDRFGNRAQFMIGGALGNAVCWALIPYAPEFSVALAIRFVEGVSSVCVIGPLLAFAGDRNPAANAASTDTGGADAGGEDSSMIYGWVGMFLMLGAGVGLAVGGIVGGRNPHLPFALAAVSMLGNAVFAFRYLRSLAAATPHEQRAPEFRATAHANLQSPANPWIALGAAGALLLTLPLALAFVDRFSVGYMMTSWNFRMRDDLGMSAATAGGIMSMIMILMSLLSPAAAALVRRGGPGVTATVRLVALGSILYGAGLALTGVVTEALPMTGAAFLAGLGAGCMHAPTMILISRLAPAAFRATAMSAYVAAGSLGNLCGPVVSRHLEQVFTRLAGSDGFALLALSFGGLEIALAILLILAAFPGALLAQSRSPSDNQRGIGPTQKPRAAIGSPKSSGSSRQ